MNVALNGQESAVRRIVDLIKNSGLKEGDRLPPIRKLAEEWNTSASIVRDMLLQAQTMGIVRMFPRSGAFVQEIDLSNLVSALDNTVQAALSQSDHNLFDIISARRLIEMETAGLAAERQRLEDMHPLLISMQKMSALVDNRDEFIVEDEAFHMGIAKIAGNTVLSTILRSLLTLLRPYRRTLAPDRASYSSVEAVHKEIYDSIMAGSRKSARAAMKKHLTDDRERALKEMSQQK